MIYTGKGKVHPVVNSGMSEGQFKNRRIKFEVVNSAAGAICVADHSGYK